MTRYLLGDLVRNCKEKVDRDNNPYEYFVAGDHMETERPRLTMRGRFDEADVGPAFIRLFRPGQVLYGSRRTYLKKVSVAVFEGVTSNVTFVLETKDDSILPQRLLPFLLLSDRFTSYSIGKSKGSTNPYVLFSDLADFEIDLPEPKTVAEIADIMCAAERLKEDYRSLIATCDDVVKSQFVEMFGDEKWDCKPLSECVNSIDTGKSMNCGEGARGVGGFGVLKLSALSSGTFVASENKVISKDNFMSIKEVEKGDLLFARKNTPELVGTTVYVPNEVKGLMFPDLVFRMKPKDINALYLLAYMRSDRGLDLIQGMAHGSAKSMVNIPKTQLARLPVPVPPLELQQEFADFAASVDKSKFAVQKALDELNATTKKILDQELGLGDV